MRYWAGDKAGCTSRPRQGAMGSLPCRTCCWHSLGIARPDPAPPCPAVRGGGCEGRELVVGPFPWDSCLLDWGAGRWGSGRHGDRACGSVPSTCSDQTTRTLLHAGQEGGGLLRQPGCVLAGASHRGSKEPSRVRVGAAMEGLAAAAPHRGQWSARSVARKGGGVLGGAGLPGRPPAGAYSQGAQ